MWVEHGVVLSAAAELAASVPALFDRIAGVIASGVETLTPILAEHDEDTEPVAVRETVSALLWMGERTFYVLARSNPSPEEYHALADRLSSSGCVLSASRTSLQGVAHECRRDHGQPRGAVA